MLTTMLPGKEAIPTNLLLSDTPFPVKRLYWIYNVPSGDTRGTHAHRTCQEWLVLLHGQIEIDLKTKDGIATQRRLYRPGERIYIPPMVWKAIRFYANPIVLVAASEVYDPDDYIYEEEFNQLCLTT